MENREATSLSFIKRLFGFSSPYEQEGGKEMLKIGIILGSTREGRLSPQVGQWVKELAENVVMRNMKLLILQNLNYRY